MVWLCWLLGLGVGGLDGIDWNERNCEQRADACNVLGAGLAGEPIVVADAVEAWWQDVHQETPDELVGIERHDLVSLGTFDPIILPREGDALVVECDEAAIGDGDARRVAREIAQHFRRTSEWSFTVDDPRGVAQRCQISGEGSGISE